MASVQGILVSREPGLKDSYRSVEELTALFEISKTLASSLDLQESASQVLATLNAQLAMKRGTIALMDPASGELAIRVSYGLSHDEQAKGRYRIGEGITGKVFETGEPIVVPDLLSDARFLNKT